MSSCFSWKLRGRIFICMSVIPLVQLCVGGWVFVQKRGIGQCSGWVVQRKFFRFVCLHYNFHDARMSHHSPMNERTGWEGAAVVVSLLRLSPLPSTVCVELLLLLLMGNHFILRSLSISLIGIYFICQIKVIRVWRDRKIVFSKCNQSRR